MKDSGSEDGLLYGGQTEQGRSEFVLKTNGRFSWQGERSKRMFLMEGLLLCLLLSISNRIDTYFNNEGT